MVKSRNKHLEYSLNCSTMSSTPSLNAFWEVEARLADTRLESQLDMFSLWKTNNDRLIGCSHVTVWNPSLWRPRHWHEVEMTTEQRFVAAFELLLMIPGTGQRQIEHLLFEALKLSQIYGSSVIVMKRLLKHLESENPWILWSTLSFQLITRHREQRGNLVENAWINNMSEFVVSHIPFEAVMSLLGRAAQPDSYMCKCWLSVLYAYLFG